MQNLQLLLHIPDLPTLDTETLVSWQLFDRQADLLRDSIGALTTLADVPRAERTVIVIPARRVVYIETPLPPVSAAKRDALLRYAIEDKLTIDPATVHAVVLGVAASNGTTNHVIAAIDRDWLAGALRWLGDAQIEPKQAISAAELIPVGKDEWGLMLDGPHGLARRADGFAYSFDVENSGASNSSIPDDPPFALALALKEARDHHISPAQLIVFTHHTNAAPWITTWQRVLECPIKVAALPEARMVSTGAGNLLVGEFAPRSTGNGWRKALKPASVLIATIAVLQIAFIVIDAWRLDQRRRVLEKEMTQVFKEAFPKAQAIVDPPLQMQRNLDTMKRERGIGTTDNARLALAQVAAILNDVSASVPQRVSIREDVVSIETLVTDPAMQSAVKSRVAETPGATSNIDSSNIVRVTVRVQR